MERVKTDKAYAQRRLLELYPDGALDDYAEALLKDPASLEWNYVDMK